MSSTRKRRADAVSYSFTFFNCDGLVMEVEGKKYVYEPVLMRMAKGVTNKGVAMFSLYRDLHNAQSVREIYGVRAICIDDFNAENKLCKINVYPEPGRNVLMFEENLKEPK